MKGHPLSTVHDSLLIYLQLPSKSKGSFFPLQTQDVPCCGDTDPLITMTVQSVHSILELLT